MGSNLSQDTDICILDNLLSPYCPFRVQMSVFLVTSNQHTTPSGQMSVFLVTSYHHSTLQDTDVCIICHLLSPYYPFRIQMSVKFVTSNQHTTLQDTCLYSLSPPITILPLQDTDVCKIRHLQSTYYPFRTHVCISCHLLSPFYPFRTHVCIICHLQSTYYPFRTHVYIPRHLLSPYYPFRKQMSVFITSLHHTTPHVGGSPSH